MAMMVENMKSERAAGLGSPGVDQLRWKKPVYPGDTLRCETEVIEKRRSASRPEMGIFKSHIRTYNQHDELVLEMPEELLESEAAAVEREMSGALELSVPIVVNIASGADWLEAGG